MSDIITPEAIAAVQYYRSKSLAFNPAIALTAVQWAESGLNPGSQGTQSSETPGVLNPKGAYGLSSWNGPRQSTLDSFSRKHGLDVSNIETQQYFTLNEIANSYPKTWAAITGTGTIEEIISVIVSDYEKPKDVEAEVKRAIEYATKLAAAVPQQQPPPIVVPVVPVPSPLTLSSPSVVLLTYLDPSIMDQATQDAIWKLIVYFRGRGL